MATTPHRPLPPAPEKSPLGVLRTLLWTLAGVIVTLVVLDVALWLLPVSGKGVYAADPDPQWPVHHLTPDAQFVYSGGWALQNVNRGHVNNRGFVAPQDYQDTRDAIVLLGDSFLESLMNDYPYTVQGRLPAQLTHARPVVALGVSGSGLPDYLGVGSLVTPHYHPAWLVVLLNDGDFNDGFAPLDGHFGWDARSDALVKLLPVKQRSLKMQLLRSDPLLRYLRNNLHFDAHALLGRNWAPEPVAKNECGPDPRVASDADLVSRFVAKLPGAYQIQPDHIVLVFDGNRRDLYAGGSGEANQPCPSRSGTAMEELRTAAARQGMQIVELAPRFRAAYQKDHRQVDYIPIDGHWNPAGHAIVAQAVAETINRVEAQVTSTGTSPPAR